MQGQGDIPLPRSLGESSASAASSSSSPRPATIAPAHSRIFPGFLASTPDDPRLRSHLSPAPKTPEVHSALPYLSSPQAGPSSSSPPASTVPPPPPIPPRSSARDDRPSRRRPSPLQLGKSRAIGLDEELEVQRELDAPFTGISVVSDDAQSSLSNDMQDLSLLRQSVKHNLLARPVDSPLAGSDSGGSSGAITPDFLRRNIAVSDADTIDMASVLRLLESDTQALVLDTRPLGEFLESHLPRSANVSIPSLIFKRFRKASSGKGATWESLGSFVSTSAGKEVWQSVNLDQALDVVVLGMTAEDETASVLRSTVEGLVPNGDVKILRGGWISVIMDPNAVEQLVHGEHSVRSGPSTFSSSLPSSSQRGQIPGPSGLQPGKVVHHPSMPSLRMPSPGGTKALPSLSLQTPGHNSSKRPPKLSLNLDKSLRSATSGSFPSQAAATANFLSAPGSDNHQPPALNLQPAKSPVHATSFQTLCLEQSKLPPSPSSFSGLKGSAAQDEYLSSSPNVALGTPWAEDFTAKPSGPGQFLPPNTPVNATAVSGLATARNGIAPFIVSTILPSFLYLGPEITSREEVEALQKIGVKRILNVAIECEDDAELRMRETFEKYLKLPMRDIVEESGVGKGMRVACKFLDDARLHSAPTYVHCKAGKSRSVTVVLAYLIHANAWTLKTAYNYVAERRKGISPNIGFVAELMQFEETELGLKQSGGVHGEGGGGRKAGGGGSAIGQGEGGDGEEGKGRKDHRYARESLPPMWASSSLDSSAHVPKVTALYSPADPGEGEARSREPNDDRRPLADDREVRKNGQWVHHRRAPVDRTTLQPGRRASKAGLESLRPLASASSSAKPSPHPSPSINAMQGDGKPMTPSGEGRLGWV